MNENQIKSTKAILNYLFYASSIMEEIIENGGDYSCAYYKEYMDIDSRLDNIMNQLKELENKLKEENNLKPCPFCGSKNLKFETGFKDNIWIKCKDCEMETKGFYDRNDLVEFWNNRHKPKKKEFAEYETPYGMKIKVKMTEKELHDEISSNLLLINPKMGSENADGYADKFMAIAKHIYS